MVQIFKNLLKNLRDFVLGDFRSNKLSDIIVNKILRYSKNKKSIKILDYGYPDFFNKPYQVPP